MQGQINSKLVERLGASGFVTIAGLANWIGCGRDKIVDAYDEIEAAGMKLMRVRGIGGSAQFIGKRMRKAPETTASINPAWLTKPMTCLRRPSHRSAV